MEIQSTINNKSPYEYKLYKLLQLPWFMEKDLEETVRIIYSKNEGKLWITCRKIVGKLLENL